MSTLGQWGAAFCSVGTGSVVVSFFFFGDAVLATGVVFLIIGGIMLTVNAMRSDKG